MKQEEKMKKFSKVLGVFLFSMMLVLGCKVCTLAAGTTIAFSDPTGAKGETITVTCKISSTSQALGAVDMTIVYDDDALEFTGGGAAVKGGSGSIRIADTAAAANTKVMSYELSFKALKAGQSSITVSNYEVVGFDESAVTVGHVGSSTVEITDTSVSLSKDASLKSLKLSAGSLSPAFSPSIMKYDVTVGADVTSLVVTGTTSNEKAAVTSITGADNLKEGYNEVKISVTAESGNTAVYTLYVTKEKGQAATTLAPTSTDVTTTPSVTAALSPEATPSITPEVTLAANITVTVNNATLRPVPLPADAELKGYTKGTLEYKGATIEALVSDYMELYLVNMLDEGGNQNYYVYYKEIDKFTEFVKIDNSDGRFIVVLDGYPKDISIYGFEKTPLIVKDKTLSEGWKYNDELIAYNNAAAEYYLLGGISESGVVTWYVYDHVMDTYQRYFVQPANLIEEESGPNLTLTEQEQQVKELNEALQKSKNARLLVIGILAFVCLVLLLATINLALKVSFLKKEMNNADESEEDEDDAYFGVFEEEQNTPKYERVVKPREPRTLPKIQVDEVKAEAEAASETEKAPQQMPKEQPVVRKMVKKSVPVAEEEFFDKEDALSEEFEAEVLKAKVQEEPVDEFEDTMKPQKKAVTKEPVEKRPVKRRKTLEEMAKSKRNPSEKEKVRKEGKKEVKGEAEDTRKQKLKKKEDTVSQKKKGNTATKPVKKSPKSIEMDFKEEDFDFEFIDLDED